MLMDLQEDVERVHKAIKLCKNEGEMKELEK